MSTCCDPPSDPVLPASPAAPKELTIALAGNPNSGKTTLFNALTGLRQKVANYPGVTVEKKTGRCKLPTGRWVNVIDLPGTYSLISRSPDETVAMEVLRGLRPDTPAPDAVIVVIDASNLQRNLYLVSQLIELGRPMIVALNMMDIAERRGLTVSPERLSHALGNVPVIPLTSHRGRGVEQLKAALSSPKVAPLPDFPLPPAMKDELLHVAEGLAILDSPAPSSNPQSATRNPQSFDPSTTRSWICRDPADPTRRLDRYTALAERLLIGDRAPDIAPLAAQPPISSLLSTSTARLHDLGIDPMQADIEAHYRWIDATAHAATDTIRNPQSEIRNLNYSPKPTLTQRVDSYLLHPFYGLVAFVAVMASLFASIFLLADPLMGLMESAVTSLGSLVSTLLPEGPIQDLWSDGIVAGVGAVVVFVPQIALLFLFLAVLEDSGYLARAAFLMDRVLGKVGLSGKSFIPLLSSFACAIPGVMAARTIENRKDRLATIFVAPFMSCSARLPVYFLLIGSFFGAYSWYAQGALMLSLYLLGILAAVATAFLFKRTLLKGAATSFILELPTYKPPQVTQVARVVGRSTWQFLTKAGTIIFCLSVILWAMTYYPRLDSTRSSATTSPFEEQIDRLRPEAEQVERDEANGLFATDYFPPKDQIAKLEADRDQALASARLRHSLAGRLGHLMEPAIRPLGYDWKMGIGLISSFAAREVFVSTMAITYSAGSEDDTTPLSDAMQADTYPDGSKVWTPAVALSLLVWFVLAMQCMSTVAIVRRETNSWRWPLFMIAYMNALAYACSFLTFQIATRFLA
jgi:ferrous iron transport protein B